MTNGVLDSDQKAEIIHRSHSMLTEEHFCDWQTNFVTEDCDESKLPWACRHDQWATRYIPARVNVKKEIVDRLLAASAQASGHCDCTIVVNVPYDELDESNGRACE